MGWLDRKVVLSNLTSMALHALSTIDSVRTKEQVADMHFMEARSKLLELAAFLDRVERATGAPDYRIKGLQSALPLLLKDGTERVATILHHWSDPTINPADKAETKAASGVWSGIK